MKETGQRYTESMVAEEGRPVSVKDVAKLLIKRRSPGTIMRIVKDFEQDHRGIGEVPRSWSVLMAWVLDILWPIPGSKAEDDEVIIKKIEGTLQAWLDGEIPWSVTGRSASQEGAARTHRDSLLHRDHVALANETIPEGLPESEPGDDAYFENGGEEILETREVFDGLWESAPDVREWFGPAPINPQKMMRPSSPTFVLDPTDQDEEWGLVEDEDVVLSEIRKAREQLEEILTRQPDDAVSENGVPSKIWIRRLWQRMENFLDYLSENLRSEEEANNQRLRAMLKERGIAPDAEVLGS
jgi:hypothetical protein